MNSHFLLLRLRFISEIGSGGAGVLGVLACLGARVLQLVGRAVSSAAASRKGQPNHYSGLCAVEMLIAGYTNPDLGELIPVFSQQIQYLASRI